MMKKDLVIGLVGTAILVTAMIGVFRFEAAQSGSSFDVAWPTATAAGPSEEGRTEEGQETPVELNVTASNVTRIEFVLEWTDDVEQSGPDTFELRVTAPNGTEYAAEPSAEGRLVVVADNLALVPQPIRVTGSSAEDAEETLAPRYTSTAATGMWSVRVVMVEAGETSTAAGSLPVPQDNGNDWTLTTQVTTYEAEATAA